MRSSLHKKLKPLVCHFVLFTIFALLLWIFRFHWTNQIFFQTNTHYGELLAKEDVLQTNQLEKTGESASLVKVRGTKTLLVSAYLEHRTAGKEVRVIVIMPRSEQVVFTCHLNCQRKLYVSEGVIKINKDFFGYPYGTADIMCPLASGCETPTRIAITLNGTKTEDHEFLEVKNQKAETESFPYNFTVCFSVMFDFTNVLQLVQSLEMLQLLGVNRVVIYKTSCSLETQRVLDYYASKGLVEVVPWSLSKYLNVSRGFLPNEDLGDIHYFGQMPALSDCLYRNMYQSRYISFQDPDELILPQSVDSWLTFLPLLEKKYGADKCYMFENNVFPSERVLLPPKPQTLPQQNRWQNVSGVNILAHVYREPIMPKLQWSKFKIIVNPRAVFTITVHGVLKSQRGCAWIDRNIGRMYHTRPQLQPSLRADQLIYDGRLLSYSTRLVPAVDTVLRLCQLLPEESTN